MLTACAGSGSQAAAPGEPPPIEPSGTAAPVRLRAPAESPAIRTPVPSPPEAQAATTTIRTETATIHYKLDTFETEETVGHEIGMLPGVLSFTTGQAEITVTFDPQITNRGAIVKVLQLNPEVRVLDP